jgi:hypothetical protein
MGLAPAMRHPDLWHRSGRIPIHSLGPYTARAWLRITEPLDGSGYWLSNAASHHLHMHNIVAMAAKLS